MTTKFCSVKRKSSKKYGITIVLFIPEQSFREAEMAQFINGEAEIICVVPQKGALVLTAPRDVEKDVRNILFMADKK